MSVVLNAGMQRTKGSFGDVEVLTQSTATARQAISVIKEVTTLSGGTATGFGVDLYTVASFATTGAGPAEGFEKWIHMLATGEAKVVFNGVATGVLGIFEIATTTNTAPQSVMTAASATGAFTLSVPHHYIFAKMVNGLWRVVGGAATFATAT